MQSYGYTDLSEEAFEFKVPGKSCDNLSQIKEAIEVVRYSFKFATPPIFLFFNARDNHYKYYREVPYCLLVMEQATGDPLHTTFSKLWENLLNMRIASNHHICVVSKANLDHVEGSV